MKSNNSFALVQKIGLMVDCWLFTVDALSHNEETDLFCISCIFAIVFTSIYFFSFFFNIFYLHTPLPWRGSVARTILEVSSAILLNDYKYALPI